MQMPREDQPRGELLHNGTRGSRLHVTRGRDHWSEGVDQ